MRKTYVATIESAVVFTADVEAGDNLEKVAQDAIQESKRDGSLNEDLNFPDVAPLRCIPRGWGDDCLVYGTHQGDLSLKQAKDLSPEYLARLKSLQQVQAQHGGG